MNTAISCPHCQAPCTADAAFCTQCGKAVTAGSGGPRILRKAEAATSVVGRALQSDELLKSMKQAFGALLAVAIVQVIFGTAILFMLKSQSESPRIGQQIDPSAIPMVAIGVYGVAVVFLGLALWARRNPFPAAIVGLVVFLTVHLVDAVQDPTAIVRGIVLKIVVILILARAISAGARYRALKKAQTPLV